MAVTRPVPEPLDLLVFLDMIDDDPAGQKLLRKLAAIESYRRLVNDHAVTEALKGVPEAQTSH